MYSDLKIFGGRAHPVLTAEMCSYLEIPCGEVTAYDFSDVPKRQPLWYENANGLAEIALNAGSAAARFALAPGHPVTVHLPG